MDPKDLRLPELGDHVATLPPLVDKIRRILWTVDPAHLPGIREEARTRITRIGLSHEIMAAKMLADLQASNAKAMADFHAAESKALQEMANELKAG